jgi:hypothetical protein
LFGYSEFAVGNPFIDLLQIDIIEAKLGLTQRFDLATREYQASDPTYASSYDLKPLVSVGTTLQVAEAAEFLGFLVPELKFEPALDPLARSPVGTLTISPATVRAGSDTQLGDRATFTVTMDTVNYLGAYSIESIEIRRWKMNGTVLTLEPGRPGCTDLAAAQGQVSFSCQTDFLEADAGAQWFHVFVRTRIFGVPIPVPLEIAADARAMISVVATSAPRGRIVLITSEPPSGSAHADNFFSSIGTLCQRNDTINSVPPLADAVSATCATSAASQAGNPMSATSEAGGTYSVTVAFGVRDDRLDGRQCQRDRERGGRRRTAVRWSHCTIRSLVPHSLRGGRGGRRCHARR